MTVTLRCLPVFRKIVTIFLQATPRAARQIMKRAIKLFSFFGDTASLRVKTSSAAFRNFLLVARSHQCRKIPHVLDKRHHRKLSTFF
uniref:Putative secreted protein n=1 Tax=Ixodes ricinus TaxID=34613 RepID=A0A6B0UBI0_IXORI